MEENKSSSAAEQQKEEMKNEEYDKLTYADSIYDVDKLFEKYFIISKAQKESYKLPKAKFMFKEPSWSLDSLQRLKSDLNEVKSCLNDFNLYEWQKHTTQTNKAGDVMSTVKEHVKSQLLTQAWLKFYEIASKFPLIPLSELYSRGKPFSFRSVHLCEAPGAFITALRCWLRKNAQDVKWSWLATSLNPYCEENAYDHMIADDRFIKHTLQHWYFGEDNTGDIMNLRNLNALVKRANSFDDSRPILLVTADGSIDCTNTPGEQESVVAQLHLCETVACMHILQKDGNFLLKIFTIFEHQSVCLMYLLSCVFHEVTVTKPATSKGGNSEMYVFCRKFRGKDYVAPYLETLRQHYGKVSPENAMFSRKDIPQSFLRRIEKCSAYFKYRQCQIIKDNIRTYRAEDCDIKDNIRTYRARKVKRLVAMKYLEICKLNGRNLNTPLKPASVTVSRTKKRKPSHCWSACKKLHIESYNERCKKHDLKESLLSLWSQAQVMNLPTKRSYILHLQISLETVKIQTGKSFTKVRSSRFSDVQSLNILNTLVTIIEREIGTTICFPSAGIVREQQKNSNEEILSFQFAPDFDNHKTITEICNRLKTLRTGQDLTLLGYSLLTQLNVGLLYLLGNCFDKSVVTICDNEGYRIRLETYQPNETTLNYLNKILAVSNNEQKKNRTVWSIVPIVNLEESNTFPLIMALNHLTIKLYLQHVMSKCIKDDTK